MCFYTFYRWSFVVLYFFTIKSSILMTAVGLSFTCLCLLFPCAACDCQYFCLYLIIIVCLSVCVCVFVLLLMYLCQMAA